MRSRVTRMLLSHPEKDPQTTHTESLGSNACAAQSPLATLLRSSSDMTRHPPHAPDGWAP